MYEWVGFHTLAEGSNTWLSSLQESSEERRSGSRNRIC